MPEALAVAAVVVLTLIAWVGAWLHARNPANRNPQHEVARLRDQAAFLEHRLSVARRERWDDHLVKSLAQELAATLAQLGAAQVRADAAAR